MDVATYPYLNPNTDLADRDHFLSAVSSHVSTVSIKADAINITFSRTDRERVHIPGQATGLHA